MSGNPDTYHSDGHDSHGKHAWSPAATPSDLQSTGFDNSGHWPSFTDPADASALEESNCNDTQSTEMIVVESDSDDMDDLFTSAFGKPADRRYKNTNDDDDDDDDDDDEEDMNEMNDNDGQAQVAPQAQADYAFHASEHRTGCKRTQTLSHRPPRHRPGAATTPTPTNNAKRPRLHADPAPLYPDPRHARSRHLRAHERLHARARQLTPRIALEAPRYWIAVLHLGRRGTAATAAAAEKHFAWMRGNRRTTVATVWHAYQAATLAEDGFVLLLGGREAVGWRDTVEELDCFADRLVVFRAVPAGHPDAGGHAVSEGVVPAAEVVEID